MVASRGHVASGWLCDLRIELHGNGMNALHNNIMMMREIIYSA